MISKCYDITQKKYKFHKGMNDKSAIQKYKIRKKNFMQGSVDFIKKTSQHEISQLLHKSGTLIN